MDYFGIIKEAFKLTIKNKYLWIFGIFVGGGLGAGFSGWSGDFSDLSSQFTGNQSMISWGSFWTNYGWIVLICAAILFFIGLAATIFSIISQGALLGSTKAIKEGKEYNFRIGFTFGWHKFWRIVAVNLLIALIIVFSIAILVLPIILFVIAKIYVLAIIYGIIIFLLDLILWLYIGLIQPYILRMAVIGNKGSYKAICLAWLFFSKNWKEIVLLYLILLAAGMVIVFGYFIFFLVIGGLLFALGLGIYLISSLACWVYAGIVIGLIIAFLIVSQGMINTFYYSCFNLLYLDLAKK